VTGSRHRRTAVLAGCAALVLALTALVGPADAGAGKKPAPEPDVVVSKFVVRDESGNIVARGATAWLKGQRPPTTVSTSADGARVATARRGHGVEVRHDAGKVQGRAVTATR
jgi:hypothetical protein